MQQNPFSIIVLFVGVLCQLACGLSQEPAGNNDSSQSTFGKRTTKPADAAQSELAERLAVHVRKLAEQIGERNLEKYDSLRAAANYVEQQFQAANLKTSRQPFEVAGLKVDNIIAETPGIKVPLEIVIICAHYDSAQGTPGANDNGTGVAALLELAGRFSKTQPDRTIRWIGFANEEPPYFQVKDQMGSWVYAKQCRQRDEKIVGVISLETIGFYSDEPGSQKYPPLIAGLYPDQGNFIAFVSNFGSAQTMRSSVNVFREHSEFPIESGAFPDSLPGIGWSDHWSFWQEGYPGFMVTDTALFRYPDYHRATDTCNKIDFEKVAKVTQGMFAVIEAMSSEKTAR